MKIKKGVIHEDFTRDLYWTRLVFLSDDETKKTQVLACSSWEYWNYTSKVPLGEKVTQEHLEGWINQVIAKWENFGEKIFDQDVHYDVYATTQEGEANGIDFLLNKTS